MISRPIPSQAQTETSTLFERSLISNVEALMHVLKGSIGTGILIIPWAMKYVGIVGGPVMLSFVFLLNVHGMHVIVRCSRHFCRKLGLASLSYGDVVFYSVKCGPVRSLQAQASKAKFIIDCMLCIILLGSCSSYVVFSAQNIRQVVSVYWPQAPEDRVFMAMLIVPFILLTFIKNLSLLAWFSTFANIFILVALCMIVGDLFQGLPSVDTRPFITNISGITMVFGASVFACEGIGTIMLIENAMRTPEDFPIILNIGMVIDFCLYAVIGFFGYLKYGSAVCSSLTLNLPVGNLFYDMVRLLYSLVIFVTFALAFYVPWEIIWTFIDEKIRPHNKYWEMFSRTSMVILICSFSIAIPNIGVTFSLIGTIAGISLITIVPSLTDLMTFHSKTEMISNTEKQNGLEGNDEEVIDEPPVNKGLSKWTVFKSIFIILLGLFGVASGAIQSVRDLIEILQQQSVTDLCRGGSNSEQHSMSPISFNLTS